MEREDFLESLFNISLVMYLILLYLYIIIIGLVDLRKNLAWKL